MGDGRRLRPLRRSQGKHAAQGIGRTSLPLAQVTAALLPVINAPLNALERDIRIGGLITSLLVTVNLPSRASLGVPRVRRIVASLYQLRVNPGTQWV